MNNIKASVAPDTNGIVWYGPMMSPDDTRFGHLNGYRDLTRSRMVLKKKTCNVYVSDVHSLYVPVKEKYIGRIRAYPRPRDVDVQTHGFMLETRRFSEDWDYLFCHDGTLEEPKNLLDLSAGGMGFKMKHSVTTEQEEKIRVDVWYYALFEELPRITLDKYWDAVPDENNVVGHLDTTTDVAKKRLVVQRQTAYATIGPKGVTKLFLSHPVFALRVEPSGPFYHLKIFGKRYPLDKDACLVFEPTDHWHQISLATGPQDAEVVKMEPRDSLYRTLNFSKIDDIHLCSSDPEQTHKIKIEALNYNVELVAKTEMHWAT